MHLLTAAGHRAREILREGVVADGDLFREGGLPRSPVSAKVEGAIRTALAAGNMGMHKIADRFGVGTGTVQRIKAER
jgi:hypothetical protein